MHDFVRFERTLPFCINEDNCAPCADGELDDSFDDSFNVGRCNSDEFTSETNQEYSLPFYSNDLVNFIIDKSMLMLDTYESLVVGIISCCGKFKYNAVSTSIKETTSQLFIKTQIPSDIQQGLEYRFFIGNIYQISISDITLPSSDFSLDGSIAVSITGGNTGAIEYSIDGILWQTSPIFTNISYADYNIQVRENGCINNNYDFNFTLANCSDFSGTTIGDLISLDVIGFQIEQCTGNDFI